jgi:cytochrome c-type biogenesis protein CcmH
MSRKMGRVWIGLAVGLLSGLLLMGTASAQEPSVDAIANKLVCQCGCNLILNNCLHEGCGSAEPMKASIRAQLAQGRTQDQIIAAFVSQYGEQVLASPPKRGFNLTAWTFPFIALIAGGVVIAYTLRSWVLKGTLPPTPAAPQIKPEDEKYRHRLEKELEEFGEGPR